MLPSKQGKSYGDPPKPNRVPQVLNLCDKVKILGLLKGGMSLVEVRWYYGKMNQTPAVFEIKSMK
jgi:hypothetical protein